MKALTSGILLYPQSRQSAKPFSPVVGIGNPLTPHPQASVPPPRVLGGVAHSLAREGLGESQFRRGDIYCGTLYIRTLWLYLWSSSCTPWQFPRCILSTVMSSESKLADMSSDCRSSFISSVLESAVICCASDSAGLVKPHISRRLAWNQKKAIFFYGRKLLRPNS
jgi:hypothetical protein